MVQALQRLLDPVPVSLASNHALDQQSQGSPKDTMRRTGSSLHYAKHYLGRRPLYGMGELQVGKL